MVEYVRLSEREAQEPAPRGPFEGVPPWLLYSIITWITSRLVEPDRWGELQWDAEGLRRLERNVRISPGLPFEPSSAGRDLIGRIESGVDELALDVLDFLVGFAGTHNCVELDAVLEEGGSVWHVGNVSGGRPGLVRRVPESLQSAADEAMTGGQQHHKYLRKAWGEAYGRSPAPDTAFKDAARAVEAVSIPVVQPPQTAPTLGLVIAEMRDHPEDFATRLTPSPPPPTSSAPPLDSVVVVREMLQLLWKSQWDRHGVKDSVPLTVSQEEAEDALAGC